MPEEGYLHHHLRIHIFLECLRRCLEKTDLTTETPNDLPTKDLPHLESSKICERLRRSLEKHGRLVGWWVRGKDAEGGENWGYSLKKMGIKNNT